MISLFVGMLVCGLPAAYALRVLLFDWEVEVWDVRIPRMEVWMCPKCLSFYIAAPFTLIWAVSTPVNLLDAMLVHLGIAFVAQFSVFLQLRIEDNSGL
jgi:hypothetical protein